MKNLLHSLCVAMAGISLYAQTPATISMGTNSANDAFFKLETGTESTFEAATWDLAFLRTSNFSIGIRTNDHKGVEVYEVGALSTWETVDPASITTYTRLYNSETSWETGAFDQGSATYGWGEYQMASHQVVGSLVSMLKQGTQFYKFKMGNFYGGYTFTYSVYDGTAWGEDQTMTVPNTATTNRFFNYVHLNSGEIVVAEPENTAWDFVATKYLTDYFGDGSMMYGVTGILVHPSIEVAERAADAGETQLADLTFSEDINTIGWNWKTYSGGVYSVDSNRQFFLKDANDQVYRIVFTGYSGSATGNISFNYENVTEQLDAQTFEGGRFAAYPNPTNGALSIVLDRTLAGEAVIELVDLRGALVKRETINSGGFAEVQWDLSSYSKGVYLVKVQVGAQQQLQKIVLQ